MTDSPSDTKFKVIIVDDVKDNLLALNALLDRTDVEIVQARSGSEALELMMKHEFCLALLDVQMPEMNGFELAELMRGTNRTKYIPIIFVTAAARNQRYVFRGYESGAVDFLVKPVDPFILNCKVSIFLELHQQKLELKRQLEELTKSREEQVAVMTQLNDAKTALEKSVNDREDFMSIASHEFKTPLTTLKLQSQIRSRNLLKADDNSFSREKLSVMFDSDNVQYGKLNRLIDDMLDVSRIISGKLSMDLEVFDLASVIKETIKRNNEIFKFAECSIEVLSDKPIMVNMDRLRIEQVMTNLLTNAVRYGAGKPISVLITSNIDNVLITVKDNGIGIAEENLKRIFMRFERATATAMTGLGLGLYIVSQIIEAHQGLIKVTSNIGEGSEFTVSLPLAAEMH